MKLPPKLIFLGIIIIMGTRHYQWLYLLLFPFFLCSCKSSIKQQEDKIYSRHLQRHIDLTIISTRIPDEKSDMNLLLYNGNDLREMDAKEIIDSLYSKKLIQPLVLVGVNGNPEEDYGMGDLASAGHAGTRADKYNSFIIDELCPFVKKKTVIRKFRSIAICGNSLAAISAFDIGWQNADKIDKVGVFSGDFCYAGITDIKNSHTQNAVLENVSASRKRPKLQYWFYAAEKNDNRILDDTKELIDIIDKKNTGSSTSIQFVSDKTGNNDIISWRHHFADFLLWAFGK